jgi:CRISPR/Cas system-associated protein Cas5 (RAMP superfamily)
MRTRKKITISSAAILKADFLAAKGDNPFMEFSFVPENSFVLSYDNTEFGFISLDNVNDIKNLGKLMQYLGNEILSFYDVKEDEIKIESRDAINDPPNNDIALDF